jgi:N-acetylglucosaminyldiphosphoundecaprenol N-acetyl-beta-D-mannosaminyltransferase
MTGRRTDVAGVPLDPMTVDELVSRLAAWSDRALGRCHLGFDVYAHCINQAAHDAAYRAALQVSDLNYADGMGVVLALRLLGVPAGQVEKATTTDLIHPLCRAWALERRHLFLLGARPGIAEAAAARLVSLCPGLVIAGTHHGYFDEDASPGVIELVNRSDADVLLVCRGVPREQLWLVSHRASLHVGLAMTGGALFDFLSGQVRRGPKVLTDHGFEWLCRLALEPRRLGRRYLLGNPEFAGRVAVAWWRRRRDAARRVRGRSGT